MKKLEDLLVPDLVDKFYDSDAKMATLYACFDEAIRRLYVARYNKQALERLVEVMQRDGREKD